MSQNFATITGNVEKNNERLGKLIPEALHGFSDLASSALKPGLIDETNKRLMALAISVTKQCVPCIGFHVRRLVALGATKEQVAEALAISVYMGGGPSLMFCEEAMRAFDEFSASKG